MIDSDRQRQDKIRDGLRDMEDTIGRFGVGDFNDIITYISGLVTTETPTIEPVVETIKDIEWSTPVEGAEVVVPPTRREPKIFKEERLRNLGKGDIMATTETGVPSLKRGLMKEAYRRQQVVDSIPNIGTKFPAQYDPNGTKLTKCRIAGWFYPEGKSGRRQKYVIMEPMNGNKAFPITVELLLYFVDEYKKKHIS